MESAASLEEGLLQARHAGNIALCAPAASRPQVSGWCQDVLRALAAIRQLCKLSIYARPAVLGTEKYRVPSSKRPECVWRWPDLATLHDEDREEPLHSIWTARLEQSPLRVERSPPWRRSGRSEQSRLARLADARKSRAVFRKETAMRVGGFALALISLSLPLCALFVSSPNAARTDTTSLHTSNALRQITPLSTRILYPT